MRTQLLISKTACGVVSLLLVTACTRSADPKSSEPAMKVAVTEAPALAPATAPAETPEPAAEPTRAAPPQAAPAAPLGTPIPQAERDLFDIIVRLVNEPAALNELAPKASFENYGVKGVDRHPLKDAAADFGFLFRELKAGLITAATPAAEMPSTPIECDSEKLTCDASYGGGQTDFLFARKGDKIVLTKVVKQLVD